MKIAVAGGTGAVGRHVVNVIHEHGHQAVVLSRSTGVDLVTGVGLREAMKAVDAVIDVASVSTRSRTASESFFRAVTSNLIAAETANGSRHHVALGIVGSLDAPFGYYAGKKVQEELVEASPVPWTIQRSTQFHEFASQIYGTAKIGPISLVPKMVSQPIAARDVAERLVELATGEAAGRVPDLGGPKIERMVDMVRAYARATGHRGPIVEVPLPGGFGTALRDGTLVARPGAILGWQTYEQWLTMRV